MGKRNGERIIDKKWNKIFNDLNILEHLEKEPFFKISSKCIGKYKEPRLMTKFDHRNSLPDVFDEYGLSILPITRGDYVIGRFNAYGKFEQKVNKYKISEVPFPQWVESIKSNKVTSEAIMLDIANISGMYNDLLKITPDSQLFETVNGRMGSGKFDFKVLNNEGQLLPLSVNNSQLEIDGGYENQDFLILIEAKSHTADSFLIRQLYYPYRVWKSRINKPIIPIYLQYDNGIYNFSIFKFLDQNNYNSIQLVERRNYIIGKENLSLDEINELSKWAEQNYIEEPLRTECAFPQADSLQKVMEIINLLNSTDEQKISKDELTLELDIVYRQADYYSNAGKYLGIFNIDSGIITFTKVGRKFYGKSIKQQRILLTRLILRHKPFNYTFKNAIAISNGHFTKQSTYKILKENNFLSGYSNSTILRRASTVNGWLKTICSFANDY